ncbi:recombination regulator RecX [Proteiniclasticum sp. SCR006]|uniref:Regulatory protein RecX n=1 Tax=Proteiniclasticum aestuarii TaxID=2817862 RepID=A0A939KKH8_9CLOT|nr:recombination regulator RecX [Proteiniclasticum aestuarii]MBO1266233.1 recombination regulator RecX [Proteiniclasticum aestuarii]
MKTITMISENKKNKDRVSIFADDEFLISCHKELIYKKSLRKGDKVDPDLLLELAREDEYMKAKDVALRSIERSLKTVHEIEKKLRDKEYTEDTIQRVIQFMEEYRLIDDYKYAETFFKEKLRTRGVKKARFELSNKGIPKDIMEKALDALSTSSVEEDSCLNLAEKKYAQLVKRETDPYKLKNKLYTFLMGKGYDYELISSTLRKVMESSE